MHSLIQLDNLLLLVLSPLLGLIMIFIKRRKIILVILCSILLTLWLISMSGYLFVFNWVEELLLLLISSIGMSFVYQYFQKKWEVVIFFIVSFLIFSGAILPQVFVKGFTSGFPEKIHSCNEGTMKVSSFEKHGFTGSSSYYVLYKVTCFGLFHMELEKSRKRERCSVSFEESSVKFDWCLKTFE